MSGGDPALELRRRLATLPGRLRDEVRAALLQAGEDVVALARRRLAQAAGPQPSQPGAPPRDAGGLIAASLAAIAEGAGAGIEVKASHPAATFLEYGTRRMAPRPFLRPAVEEARPAVAAYCRQALARAAAGKGDGA